MMDDEDEDDKPQRAAADGGNTVLFTDAFRKSLVCHLRARLFCELLASCGVPSLRRLCLLLLVFFARRLVIALLHWRCCHFWGCCFLPAGYR
jgi:hypothetical protein